MPRALLLIAAIVSSCGSLATPAVTTAPPIASPAGLQTATPISAATASPKSTAAVALAFTLPSDCRIVDSSHDGVSDEWLVDCGAARNRTARDTAGAALAQQGWTSCGSGLGSSSWSKGPTMIVVSEPADPSVGFRVAQRPKVSPCA